MYVLRVGLMQGMGAQKRAAEVMPWQPRLRASGSLSLSLGSCCSCCHHQVHWPPVMKANAKSCMW
jgi:hypothetical protein